MGSGNPSLGCFILAMIGVLIVAIWGWTRDQQKCRAAAAERAAQEAEEKFRPYPEAWSAARASDNVDALVRCGDFLIKAARLWQPHLVAPVAWEVYREILQLLRDNPGLKPFVLEVGRTAYSERRAGGVLTVYDEQAIQNDILAHSG